ncbi:MAG: ferrous iron transport protein A [Bacteroidetes bacterium]|jgi:ferrous iron transport protein A|nr:ferrous iron transport protein A [Bacteroidota bacterium]
MIGKTNQPDELFINLKLKKDAYFRSTKLYNTVVDKKLSEILPGNICIIQQFTDEEIKLKLMEMGCIPGEKVQVERVAPLGDPIAIAVAGYILSIRKSEAETVLVSTL